MEHHDDGDANFNRCTQNNPQMLVKGTRRLGNKRKSGDHLDYMITKTGQNTEKSPGELKRHTVTQTPVKTISRCWCEILSKE